MHMNEFLDSVQLAEQVRHIIKSKDWYSLTESSGSYIQD